jgi:hypothetical protein
MITASGIYSDHRQAVTFTAGAVSILVLALGWWLASPLFINDTVDEDFPLAAGAVDPGRGNDGRRGDHDGHPREDGRGTARGHAERHD